MKTYKNLYPQICDFTTLHSAYNKAKCLKRYREEVLKFSYRQEQELSRLRDELVRQAYTHGRYREFLVNDSKKRLIRAAPFRDRVVHKAVFMVLEPVFEPCFIFDSYACRTGKGTHKAVRRLETFLQSGGGGSVKGCVGFAM